jgi:hypothetical protein
LACFQSYACTYTTCTYIHVQANLKFCGTMWNVCTFIGTCMKTTGQSKILRHFVERMYLHMKVYLYIRTCMKTTSQSTMGDQCFVLICSGIPGDCDALYFLQEEKPIFSFLGNIFWLKCNYTNTKKTMLHFKLHIHVFLCKKLQNC